MKESEIFSEQNLSERIHYVYRVTIDGYHYIGKRTGRLDDLHTGAYKTSSKLIHEKLRDGLHFSKIKILGVFSTEKEAYEFEEKYLARVDAKRNPKFLNQTNGGSGNYTLKQHTEKTKEKISEKRKEYFNSETEEGRRNKEKRSQLTLKQFDSNTEEGRRNKEKQSKIQRARFDKNTELGRKRRENQSESAQAQFDINTEQGRKLRENQSERMKEFYKTGEGRKNREKSSERMKERAKERLQNKQNSSILGELMFDEEFIRQNFLILDDKNNLRFLWTVYSKLTGFSKAFIIVHKREGKLSFLYGIASMKIPEEQARSKIKEIEAIIKSRNNA